MSGIEEAVTPQDLDALRKLAEGATPGPWEAVDYGFEKNGVPYKDFFVDLPAEKAVIHPGNEMVNINRLPTNDQDEANCRFIAAANPQAIIALLDRLQAAESRAERAEGDARRYRWLRSTDELDFNLMDPKCIGEVLDAAIDAALSEQPAEGPK